MKDDWINAFMDAFGTLATVVLIGATFIFVAVLLGWTLWDITGWVGYAVLGGAALILAAVSAVIATINTRSSGE